jgi:L-rhamnose mutarotase
MKAGHHLIFLTLLALLPSCTTSTISTSQSPTTKPAIPACSKQLPAVGAVHGPSNPAPLPPTVPGVKYYSSIVGLKPEKEKQYRRLHANVWPEVVAAIRKANITNFNIYVTEIEGRRYLISTFEYVGTDPAKDFGSIGKDPTTRDKWWPITDACQIRLPGTPASEQWRAMEQVMHLP